ncbi:2OG-Fe(II) oxygenase [Plantactinospora veratri]|uniref:2OG-Fe(II) oxygenase n=1 Tax=Plantactinospora veratri TaxID=1436122 RepID=A0ABU7SKK5_9ACTN
MPQVRRASAPLIDAIAAARRNGLPAHRTSRPGVVTLDEFLARPELDSLVEWVLRKEAQFASSGVISAVGKRGRFDRHSRRSTVLYTPGPLRALFEQRLISVLPHVCGRLGHPVVPVRGIEMQITASNDGDYFHAHTDNAHESVAARKLTYVYFFHREPARFTGGRLRVFGGGQTVEVVPRQNQVVFFLPTLQHEIETVRCPSGLFVDSRFTVNGWYLAPS